jgi:hypothetical protein
MTAFWVGAEHVLLPSDQVQSVDVVDVLLALVDLALNPMSVEVTEEMVVVGAGGGVSVPLLDVESQKSLV